MSKGATPSKKPKNYLFHAEWEQDFFFKMSHSQCVCLICRSAVALPKKCNVERHFRTVHKHYDADLTPNSEPRRRKVEELKSRLTSTSGASVQESYSEDVAIITDSGHQHSRGAGGSQRMTRIVKCDTVGMKRRWESSKCDRTVQTNIEKPQDCDEYYFMNLVKMFKKLSPQKKSEVRMKIERLLFEAEFE